MATILEKAKALKSTLAGGGGFTLIELVIAVGLLTMATGMIGGALFQVHSIQRYWRDGAVATMELRHAGSRFAGDALKAENVLDGPPPAGTNLSCNPTSPANSVTLILSDGSGSHVVTYLVTGDTLNRDYDGLTTVVAREVVSGSVGFSLCNNDLKFDLAVDADRGTTESISLTTHIRKLD
ncbi:MAG: hypothetical protein IIB30_00280 [Chloroflexi bacterium]|nr:hypothetical protein [Chloroflexota bacterium]MCH8224274.1 hypothetical protein [Chloroflexota bacterium]